MATIKIKFRPSAVDGEKGTLYYRIIHNRMVRQISTRCRVFAWEWKNGKLQIHKQGIGDERRDYLLSLQRHLRHDMRRLQTIVRQLERRGKPYTPEQVINAYMTPDEDEELFCVFARNSAMQLKRIGKTRLAEIYSTSANSFLRFRGEMGDVHLDDLSPEIVMEYEAHLRKQGLVPNTTSFYMRNLRAIYNRAVEKKLVTDRQPFRHVYTGIGKTMKRAVPTEVISRIKGLDLSSDSALAQARDLFMFSFYTRGMSFIDMAYLRKKDLHDGVLSYRRHKTGRQLSVKWEKPMQEIADRYRNPSSPYLLSIIPVPGSNERQQYLNALHRMNSNLKVIGAMAESPVTLTSYVARHCWASIAKSRNIPLSVISEGMGHDSESTTRIYLSSIDTSAIDDANSMVIRSV